MFYPIAISLGDEQHAWGVEVPDIPGCFSAGDDLDDAMAMAREAIEGHLEIPGRKKPFWVSGISSFEGLAGSLG